MGRALMAGRSIALDVVRILAITAVIARHTWYDPEGIVALVVCPWAVGVFFVLTGYLWSSRRNVVQEADHRAVSLLVPYATWMVLISVPFFIWFFQEDAGLARLFLPGFAYGAQFAPVPYSACWFFTVMFWAALLMRVLERSPRWVWWAVLVPTALVTVGAPKLLWYLPLGLGLALPCLVFVLAGRLLRRLRPRLSKPLLPGLLLLGAGTAGVLLGGVHNLAGEILEIKHANFGFPVLGLVIGAVISAGIILLAEAVEPVFPRAWGPGVSRLAATATFVMFAHPLVLFLLDTPVTGRWPDFVLALVAPTVLALVLQSRGWLPWLTGDVPNRKWLERRLAARADRRSAALAG